MLTRSYLEAWATPRGQVHVWDLEAQLSLITGIGNATVVSRAYDTQVTSNDLEAEFAEIEGAGIQAIRTLAGGGAIRVGGQEAVIRFLEMHRERGLYADQVKTRVPVISGNFMTGAIEERELGLGDRLTLARSANKEDARITDLRLDRRRWQVVEVSSGLLTGDGAVLQWAPSAEATVSTVTFPISPKRLLIVGDDIDVPWRRLNYLAASRSRRWIVGQPGSECERSLHVAYPGSV